MIFGSYHETDSEKQKRIHALIHGRRRFVILGQLDDGRWVFMQHVWEYYDGIVSRSTGLYSLRIVGGWDDYGYVRRWYIDQSRKHVKLEEVK